MESVPYVLRDRYTFFLFSYPNREKMKQYILLIALLLPVVLHAQSLSGISSHEVVPEHPRLLLTKGEETQRDYTGMRPDASATGPYP